MTAAPLENTLSLACGPITSAVIRPACRRRRRRMPARRTEDEHGIDLAPRQAGAMPASRAIARIPAREVDCEREAGLPGQHGVGAGAIAPAAQQAQRAARRRVQRERQARPARRRVARSTRRRRRRFAHQPRRRRIGPLRNQMRESPTAAQPVARQQDRPAVAATLRARLRHAPASPPRRRARRRTRRSASAGPGASPRRRRSPSATGVRRGHALPRRLGRSALEARIAHRRIDAPEDDHIGAIADFAERRRGAAALLSRQNRRQCRVGRDAVERRPAADRRGPPPARCVSQVTSGAR